MLKGAVLGGSGKRVGAQAAGRQAGGSRSVRSESTMEMKWARRAAGGNGAAWLAHHRAAPPARACRRQAAQQAGGEACAMGRLGGWVGGVAYVSRGALGACGAPTGPAGTGRRPRRWSAGQPGAGAGWRLAGPQRGTVAGPATGSRDGHRHGATIAQVAATVPAMGPRMVVMTSMLTICPRQEGGTGAEQLRGAPSPETGMRVGWGWAGRHRQGTQRRRRRPWCCRHHDRAGSGWAASRAHRAGADGGGGGLNIPHSNGNGSGAAAAACGGRGREGGRAAERGGSSRAQVPSAAAHAARDDGGIRPEGVYRRQGPAQLSCRQAYPGHSSRQGR